MFGRVLVSGIAVFVGHESVAQIHHEIGLIGAHIGQRLGVNRRVCVFVQVRIRLHCEHKRRTRRTFGHKAEFLAGGVAVRSSIANLQAVIMSRVGRQSAQQNGAGLVFGELLDRGFGRITAAGRAVFNKRLRIFVCQQTCRHGFVGWTRQNQIPRMRGHIGFRGEGLLKRRRQ